MLHRCKLLLASVAALAAASCAPQRTASELDRAAMSGSRAERCAGLASARLDDVEIVSAAIQPAEAIVPGAAISFDPRMPGPPVSGLPAFCRVVGSIHPEAGSNIRFEVWLPEQDWDGRLHGIGNGGFAGTINYIDLATAIATGTVGASTDTGHSGAATDGAWARGRPELVRDYGWRAIHLTAVAAKDLIEAFYGHGPDHSYFMSCSNGGRQGLIEASRFPEDYDGIVAAAPAAVFTDLAMSMAWTVQAQAQPDAALRPAQASFLQAEVVAQCDRLDGQSDGIVADPRQCQIDTSRLECGANESPHCFSPKQTVALRQIYRGPHDSSGRRLARAYLPSGAEAGTPMPQLGWDGYIISTSEAPGGNNVLSNGMLQNIVQAPFTDAAHFDFDRDPARLRASVSQDLDAQPNLRRYFERGGKLILWHGWADAAIPPEATIDFYEATLRSSGGHATDAVRLFMVPALQHCFGGVGATNFGQFGPPPRDAVAETNVARALLDWVEHGRAPETLVARTGSLTDVMGAGSRALPALTTNTPPQQPRERLLCPYPATAQLRSSDGDVFSAASYECRTPRS